MVEGNGPSGEDAYGDARYFGPFGEVPPGPTYQPYGTPASDPLAAPSVLASPPPPPPPVRRRGPGPLGVIGIAAATAMLVGGGSGYGGAKLAGRGSAVAPSPSTSSSAEPSARPSTTATPLPPAPGTANTVEVAKRTLPSTVMIQAQGATGSGFVLDTDGRIMTNNHVVAGAADGGKIRVVFSNGKRASATVIGRSPSYDIAVIKVKAATSLKPIALGNSDQTEVGQPVIAIGSPLGLPGTVTQGIVSARNRPVVVGGKDNADAPTAYINAIQTDASINPGNSGGPMVDAAARVIGVNSAILTLGSTPTQTGNIGLGFAIPINQARVIGDQLVAKGKATYPVLGASVRTASGGVELTSLEGNGPAAKAGLRKGDVITKIDGQAVRAMDELIVTIRTRRPGQVVALNYTRGSSDDQVRVKLGSRVG